MIVSRDIDETIFLDACVSVNVGEITRVRFNLL